MQVDEGQQGGGNGCRGWERKAARGGETATGRRLGHQVHACLILSPSHSSGS